MSTALFVVAAAVAAGWAVLAVVCISNARWSRFLRPSDRRVGPDAPTIAAVVPARNESAHIGATLRDLVAQDYPHLTILVVDDQSTDDTPGAVRRFEAGLELDAHPVRLLPGVERPAGWVGKTWALHQGVEATDSDWLWLVDADVRLHPRALATAWHEAVDHGADLVSLLGRPRCETFWQGSIALALLQVLSMLYPLRKVNDPKRPEALAHGAFVLVRRSTCEHVGGIEAIRGEVVEDIRFAERAKRAGARIRVRAAPGLSGTHMYGTLADIWNGLRKNAFAGMDYKLHKYATGALLGLLMAWAPVVSLIAGLVGAAAGWPGAAAWVGVGAAGWLAMAAAASPVVVYLDLPRAFAFALPAGIAAYVAITTTSVVDALRGHVRWKGRHLSIRPAAEGERLSRSP